MRYRVRRGHGFHSIKISESCPESSHDLLNILKAWARFKKRTSQLHIAAKAAPNMIIHIPVPFVTTHALDITPHARIRLSVYPANSVCPSALHAKLTHSGSLLFLPTAVYSGFNSSTLLFFSRSKMIMLLEVAAHSQ